MLVTILFSDSGVGMDIRIVLLTSPVLVCVALIVVGFLQERAKKAAKTSWKLRDHLRFEMRG
jgi:hypothetical protein